MEILLVNQLKWLNYYQNNIAQYSARQPVNLTLMIIWNSHQAIQHTLNLFYGGRYYISYK